MKKLWAIVLSIFLCFCLAGCNSSPKLESSRTIGVWWWNDELGDKYLKFANENGVDEIYFCNQGFDAQTAQFIEKANSFGMKVYALWGDYQWLRDSGELDELIENYKSYQLAYPDSTFAGIHLDIEPHQDPNFDNERIALITSLVNIAYQLKINQPEISFDYDIPFGWKTKSTSTDRQKKRINL